VRSLRRLTVAASEPPGTTSHRSSSTVIDNPSADVSSVVDEASAFAVGATDVGEGAAADGGTGSSAAATSTVAPPTIPPSINASRRQQPAVGSRSSNRYQPPGSNGAAVSLR